MLLVGLAALAVTALYIFVVYGFVHYVWPSLPPWASLLCFIALAAFAIGSPMFWLMRLGRNTSVPPHLIKPRK